MEFMAQINPNIMKDQRNEKGQFAPGHDGFKPVGATKRKKNHEMDRLKEIFDFIQPYIEKDLIDYGGHTRINTMLEICKILNSSKKAKKMKTSGKPARDK